MNGFRVVAAEDFELHDRSFYQSARTVGGRVAEPPLREMDAWRYAREQSLDGINFAEGFAFRYGSTHGAG